MKIDETILDKPIGWWLKRATEDELREFLRVAEGISGTPRYAELMKEFDAECRRRTIADFESRNGGEWI